MRKKPCPQCQAQNRGGGGGGNPAGPGPGAADHGNGNLGPDRPLDLTPQPDFGLPADPNDNGGFPDEGNPGDPNDWPEGETPESQPEPSDPHGDGEHDGPPGPAPRDGTSEGLPAPLSRQEATTYAQCRRWVEEGRSEPPQVSQIHIPLLVAYWSAVDNGRASEEDVGSRWQALRQDAPQAQVAGRLLACLGARLLEERGSLGAEKAAVARELMTDLLARGAGAGTTVAVGAPLVRELSLPTALAQGGDVESLKVFLEREGFDPNVPPAAGEDLLLNTAAEARQPEVVAALLAARALPETRGRSNRNSLQIATALLREDAAQDGQRYQSTFRVVRALVEQFPAENLAVADEEYPRMEPVLQLAEAGRRLRESGKPTEWGQLRALMVELFQKPGARRPSQAPLGYEDAEALARDVWQDCCSLQ